MGEDENENTPNEVADGSAAEGNAPSATPVEACADVPAEVAPAPVPVAPEPPVPAYAPPPPAYAPPSPPAGYAPAQPGQVPPYGPAPKEKAIAGILGILLGAYGAHKFYLGYTNEAIIMLGVSVGSIVMVAALSWLGIGLCFVPVASAMSIIGLVEGIIYLTRTDQDFYYIYVLNKKPWF